MPRYIVTGNYTAEGIKGMVASPGDRESVARAIVEAAGGTLETYYMVTGDADFSIKVSIDDAENLMAGLMVAASKGAVCNLKTVRAFTSDEFTAIQTKANKIAEAL